MLRVLVVDLGSRLNTFGGQAKMAEMLTERLGKRFRANYLGYRTIYTKRREGDILLKGSNVASQSTRNSRLSEARSVKILYNWAVVQRLGMLGISREELCRKVQEFGPDAIIANSPADFPLLKLLKSRGLGFRSIYIDHGSISTTAKQYLSKEGIPITFGTGLMGLTINRVKRRFFRFFDASVALNRDQFNEIKRFTSNAVLINNCLDIRPAVAKGARSGLGLRRGDFVVGYIGRMFERQKNVSTLIKAFMGLDGGDLKLLLVGDGPSTGSYKTLANGDKRIIFTGRLGSKRIEEVYSSLDAFVLPSRWEGLALTVLEAAAYSIPIILSKSAYIKDLKLHGIGRVLSFDDDDIGALRRLIVTLRGRGAHRNAVKVSNSISEKFSESNMVKKYEDLLIRLCGRP